MSVTLPREPTTEVRDWCLCLHLQRAARAVARQFDDTLRPLKLTNGQRLALTDDGHVLLTRALADQDGIALRNDLVALSR